ncbi:MAG: HAD family hydrolase [Oscillospiraceae bacterium]|nr:HAD family hydrolase [Oscillospiraceae bacterium]
MNISESLLTNKDFSLFARLAIAAVIAIVCAAANISEGIMSVLCIAAILIAAFELVVAVLKNIIKFKFFNEQFIMLISLIITLAAGRYAEAVLAAMLFRISDFLSVKLRMHALQMAKSAGCEPDTEKKSRMDSFTQKALHIYIPAVIVIALLIAIIPMLFIEDTAPWLSRAAIILFVGSPCAITFSMPLCNLFAIYKMSREGIFISSASTMDMLAATNTVVFDNTDALAANKYIISDVMPVPGLSSTNLLMLAAYAASSAGHPAADAITAAYGDEIDPLFITGSEQLKGFGILAHVKGLVVSAGNLAMMEKLGLSAAAAALSIDPSAVHIAINGSYAGCIVITRMTNESAKSAIEALASAGVGRTVLLSSDTTKVTSRAAHTLGFGEYFPECSETDKVRHLEKLLADTFPEEALSFVGSSPEMLELADVGISVGENVKGCDAVLTTDDLSVIASAIEAAKRGRSIIVQGLAFAIVLKLAILILTLIGIAPFWLAVLADSGVAILTVANAMRAGR